MTILDGFLSLAKNINKARGRDGELENDEGIVSEKLPELALTMDNGDLAQLTSKWQKEWEESSVYSEWKEKGDEAEKYWLGKQFDQPKADKTHPLVDNVIFESLETYLPQITRRNPEPMVSLAQGQDETDEAKKFVTDLQKLLGQTADELKLRLRLKRVGRHWSIYLLGVGKLGWDLNRDIPTVKIIRARKVLLDPTAINDEDGYSGDRIGEYRKMGAGKMLKILKSIGGEADGIKALEELVGKDTGTEIQFIEWWTDEYMCWKMKSVILLKKKNPHWNWATTEEVPATEQEGETPAIEGQEPPAPQTVETPGFNHFTHPKKPYILLTVFTLDDRPVDNTSLITQNLASQDLINKRVRQIDKNADSMNGGMVVSGERSGLSKEQAKGVTEAVRRGGTVWIPTGAVSDAVVRMSAPSLPADVYNQLSDTRNRVRDIFGTRGTSPAGNNTERTVRGKLQNQQFDTDRIGGGFSEYLEQFADDVYNWFVQLLYVYDEKYAGQDHPKVTISVKEGSLLPKDSTTIANQAIELAGAGKMSLVDLYKRLDYSNPEELAANVWLEANAPEVLFAGDPRVQQVMQARQQAASANAAKPPSESINFKDLPPEGKAQMAKQAGIELHPEAIAAHDEHKANTEAARSMPPVPQPEQAQQ